MNQEPNLAAFCDFENLAIGARDAGYGEFDINLALERMLDKGRVLIKRAYSDWKRYSDHRRPLHEAGFELIEIPHVSYSGKNSADIHLVVDALDLCYTRKHIDVFVIMSGDSDFSPLVRKLRENNKRVVGLGVKNATSSMLIESCDEFIFYDDLVRRKNRAAAKAETKGRGGRPAPRAAAKADAKAGAKAEAKPDTKPDAKPDSKADAKSSKQEAAQATNAAAKVGDVEDALDMVLDTVEALFRERDGDLHASYVKQTLKRKRPHFDEAYFGFRTFTQLLDEAKKRKLLEVTTAEKGGGYLITGFGDDA